jgi:hypothetical protein
VYVVGADGGGRNQLKLKRHLTAVPAGNSEWACGVKHAPVRNNPAFSLAKMLRQRAVLADPMISGENRKQNNSVTPFRCEAGPGRHKRLATVLAGRVTAATVAAAGR